MIRPKWEYVLSKYSDSLHTVVYRDDLLKIQMQVVTKRSEHYNPEKAKFFFSIDDDKRIFRSEEELIGTLARKFESTDRERFSLIVHWARSMKD